MHTFTLDHTKNFFLTCTSNTPIIQTHSSLAPHSISLTHSLLTHNSYSYANSLLTIVQSFSHSFTLHSLTTHVSSRHAPCKHGRKVFVIRDIHICYKERGKRRCLMSGRFTSATKRGGWTAFVIKDFHICCNERGNKRDHGRC